MEDYEASVPEVAYKVDEEPIESDAELQLLVDGWTQRAHEELGTPVGYNVAEIEKANWTMANWITDSWLWAFPEADIAIEIFGGMRQSIPTGPFSEYDVVGMLPFDNVIYQVELTGAQVIANLDRGYVRLLLSDRLLSGSRWYPVRPRRRRVQRHTSKRDTARSGGNVSGVGQ